MFMRGRVANRSREWRGEGRPTSSISYRIRGRISPPIRATLLDTRCRTESHVSYWKHSSTVPLTRHYIVHVHQPPGGPKRSAGVSPAPLPFACAVAGDPPSEFRAWVLGRCSSLSSRASEARRDLSSCVPPCASLPMLARIPWVCCIPLKSQP